MSANVNNINAARSKVAREVLSSLRCGEIRKIRFPIGALFSNQMLYAKGPKISFRVISSQNFSSSIEGEFIESGINQTLHRLYIDFYADITISLPLKSVKVPFGVRYLLSEVVIVGEVPENYTDINRTFDDITESEIDDINDFGA
ncbi:MAG: sporulation protein YunB [Clostridia bacterium]|nr:sporulation protein YunB [Clostridia bacterium]